MGEAACELPEGQPPGTGFREDGRAESTARPKWPESGPRPETLVTGSTIRTVVSSPIATLRQQVGKLRPGKSGAARSPDRQGLVVLVPRAPSGALWGRSLQAQVRELGVSSQGPGAPGGGAEPGCEGGQVSGRGDPDVGAPRSPDPGRTTPVSVQSRTRDRGCAARRGRGALTIRGSWRRRRPARSLPVGSAPPPVPRWWPLRPRGPARDAQAQTFPTGASPHCFSELVVPIRCPTQSRRAGVDRRARIS